MPPKGKGKKRVQKKAKSQRKSHSGGTLHVRLLFLCTMNDSICLQETPAPLWCHPPPNSAKMINESALVPRGETETKKPCKHACA